MSMVKISYTSRRTGLTKVYLYAPPERSPSAGAVRSCRRALGQKKVLYLVGKARWHAGGRRSRVFQGATVEQLIRRGEAVRDGDVVRAAQ